MLPAAASRSQLDEEYGAQLHWSLWQNTANWQLCKLRDNWVGWGLPSGFFLGKSASVLQWENSYYLLTGSRIKAPVPTPSQVTGMLPTLLV